MAAYIRSKSRSDSNHGIHEVEEEEEEDEDKVVVVKKGDAKTDGKKVVSAGQNKSSKAPRDAQGRE